jgi:hypothetical protein
MIELLMLATMTTAASATPKVPIQVRAQVKEVELFDPPWKSCMVYWNDENKRWARDWVLAFWNGKNSERLTTTGKSVGVEGIVAEAKRQCTMKPSADLLKTTESAYDVIRTKEGN